MEKESRSREVVVSMDPLNEQVIIAAACVDDAVRSKLVKQIPADYFLVTEHRAAWAGLIEMERRKLGFDIATLQQVAGDTVDIRLISKLVELRPEVPDNLAFHTETLRWDRARATAVTGPIAALIEAVQNPREVPERVRALARQVGASFDGHASRRYLRDPAEIVREQCEVMEARAAGHAIFPFGVQGLDDYEHEVGVPSRRRMIPGSAPGMITVVTGVSGAGKSTATGHLILGLARQRRRVVVGAWEMNSGNMLELLALQSLGFSRSESMEGRLSVEQRAQVKARMELIAEWVWFLDNPFRRGTGEKTSKDGNARNLDIVQAYLSDVGADVFVADLWERCLVDDDPKEEKQALFRQQVMAEELHCHCILLAQQRLKDIETRADKRPTREGIKGSSAWVDVADNIIGLHRPALWKQMEDNTIEMFVLKQRYGKWPVGIEFEWNAERGSISGGRGIPYEQPGASAENEWVAPNVTGKKRR